MIHRVIAIRERKWWVVEYPEDDRLHSQARHFGEISELAAELLTEWYRLGGDDRIVWPSEIEILVPALATRLGFDT